MKPLLTLLLTALALHGCQKKADETPPLAEVCPQGNTVTKADEAYQKIVGTWAWVSDVLVNRGGGYTETPRSTGRTQQFVFNPDRTYRFLVNQALSESGTFEIRPFLNDPVLVIELKPTQRTSSGGVLLTLCDEGLVFAGGATDGINASYSRVR